MKTAEKNKLFQQIVWDYDLPAEDIIAVLNGEKMNTGHYTREKLFQKIIESYSWFTILQLFSPIEIRNLLTDQVIEKLRSPSLRQQYEFVQKRLQQLIPASR
jgi:hypothetical protein